MGRNYLDGIRWKTAVFDALAPSKHKEHVRQVTSARAEETRQRRIVKIVAALND